MIIGIFSSPFSTPRVKKESCCFILLIQGCSFNFLTSLSIYEQVSVMTSFPTEFLRLSVESITSIFPCYIMPILSHK